jgi:hypothetical protein
MGGGLLESIIGASGAEAADQLAQGHAHHSPLPLRQLPIQQQWGVWLIAVSLPLVFADTQLAARSRRRDADRALKAENALLSWMHSELDLIEADLPSSSSPPQATSAGNRRKLQLLLSLLNSPELDELYRG